MNQHNNQNLSDSHFSFTAQPNNNNGHICEVSNTLSAADCNAQPSKSLVSNVHKQTQKRRIHKSPL